MNMIVKLVEMLPYFGVIHLFRESSQYFCMMSVVMSGIARFLFIRYELWSLTYPR